MALLLQLAILSEWVFIIKSTRQFVEQGFFQNKDSLQSKYTVQNLAEQNKPRCFLFVVVVIVMLLLSQERCVC